MYLNKPDYPNQPRLSLNTHKKTQPHLFRSHAHQGQIDTRHTFYIRKCGELNFFLLFAGVFLQKKVHPRSLPLLRQQQQQQRLQARTLTSTSSIVKGHRRAGRSLTSSCCSRAMLMTVVRQYELAVATRPRARAAATCVARAAADAADAAFVLPRPTGDR